MDGLLSTLLVILVITCLLVRRFGRFVYLTWKIPGPSIWKLLTVHSKSILNNELLIVSWKMCESYDYKPWGLWAYQYFTVVISDPDAVGEVLKNKNFFDKPSLMYSAFSHYIGNGLLTHNGDKYRHHRKLLLNAFRRSLLVSQLPSVNEEAKTLLGEIRKAAESTSAVEVQSLIRNRAMSLAMSFGTSGTYVYHNTQRASNAVGMAFAIIQLRVLNPFYFWFLKMFSKSFRETESIIEATFDSVKEHYRDLKAQDIGLTVSEDIQPSNLYGLLLRAHMNGEEGFSEEECFQEAKTFTGGVSETTSSTMIATVLMLALHQDVQQRVYDEMESIFGQNHRSVEMEDIAQMDYLDMVVKETLRLFPPAPMIARKVEEEANLNGIVLPKGTTIAVNMFAMHRNPKLFKDPLKFDPERFSPERSNELHPNSFIPFSSGPRICPGQEQGMIVLKTFLCQIVRHFKVLPSDKIKSMDDIHVKMDFMLHFSDCSLRFVNREID